jgi:pyruvate dehydrogenase E2 component (dihydrolipoyllysine-residue acetyltransferase)
MTTDVILPALGMAQDSGTIVRWLKAEGAQVTKGEPVAEIETDKATVEIEAPASGVLAAITAAAGATVPTGQVIARIEALDEMASASLDDGTREGRHYISDLKQASRNVVAPLAGAITGPSPAGAPASPLASRIAAEHQLDLSLVQASGRRIQKADVMTYLQGQGNQVAQAQPGQPAQQAAGDHHARLLPASPKARRLALASGANLAAIKGSGPGGAVLVADVLALQPATSTAPPVPPALPQAIPAVAAEEAASLVGGDGAAGVSGGTGHSSELAVAATWRVMAERTTQSWTGTPHFYLVREVNASRLVAWREQVRERQQRAGHGEHGEHGETNITYTDLLVKIVAAALRSHPRVNASWHDGKLSLFDDVHVGLAVAVDQGLVVPVIHHADRLTLREVAARRQEAVALAQAGKLRPADLQGGTFTISNLGMYGVDAFNAIINQPQAAILAVGRIAERVVPLHGQPSVQPVLILTLSCDHRAIDGARGAQFLSTVAELVEEPLGLLD